MKSEDFDFVATTNDLSQEKTVRNVADLIEFQMERAEDPINQVSEYRGELPLIAISKCIRNNEKVDGSERIDRLTTAARFGHVEMVDIKLKTAREQEWLIEELRDSSVEIIISYYDFDQTPSKDQLADIVSECDSYGDISKIATTISDMADSLNLLGFLEMADKGGMRVAGIPIGDSTRHIRAITPFYGSELVYAPINLENSGSIFNQITIRDLASLVETIAEGNDNVELMDSLKGKFPDS